MQADTRSKQFTFPDVCPLCNTPLNIMGSTSSASSTVTCSTCGYFGPNAQRQRLHTPPVDRQAPSAQGGPSVWIDPAISAFLLDGQDGQVDYTQNILQPRTQQPKKPQSISSSHYKGPVTPIPARASAHQQNNVKVRPKYSAIHSRLIQQHDGDTTRIPTRPQSTMWQYESPDFEVESSLATLSLIVDAPTHPEPSFSPKRTDRLPYLDEIDTNPMPKKQATDIDELDTDPGRHKSRQVEIDEIDTLPQFLGRGQSNRALVTVDSAPVKTLAPVPHVSQPVHNAVATIDPARLALANENTDPSSWTAGNARGSLFAQRIAEREVARHARSLHPLDQLRWWLLYPRRLEFILWLGGTIVLLSVTFLLLLASAISLSWIAPSSQNGSLPLFGGSSSTSPVTTSTTPTNTITNGKLSLSLDTTEPLVPGQPLHLHGQGFSRLGTIVFTDENKQPLFELDSQNNSTKADVHGSFSVTLSDTGWNSGTHHVVASDVATHTSVDLLVMLVAGPFGKSATPTPAAPSPGLTATATTTTGSGSYPTAVPSPTVLPRPTAVTTQPVPTPTQQPSPTPTATPIVTPTATPGDTPTVDPTPTTGASSSFFNGGSNSMGPSAAASIGQSNPLSHADATFLSSWSWLLILGYILAMCLLGIAGVLHRRRRHI
ncbi:MAG: hypothetical protein NVS4B7_11950 [Ktedonobacteraceae bacterium]